VSIQVPERVRWAVDVLDVGPSEEILEIGPGPGVAVSLVCDRLVDGHITAIDRSATAVRRTSERNAACIGSGKATVLQAELSQISPGPRFDKIFAINVNLFWVQPDGPQLAVVANLLRPVGRLFLFYEAPSSQKADHILQIVDSTLRRNGFATSTRSASDPAVRYVEAWRGAGRPLARAVES
jgi:trans-aconitate methyltransferase